MTSLRAAGSAIILIPAGVAALTLVPTPHHHSEPVSSPPVAATTPRPHHTPTPSLPATATPSPSASSVLPSVWPSSTHAPAASPPPLSPDISKAALTFARAWLIRDPAARKVALIQIAAPTLMGSLMAMHPDQIPATTVSGPVTLAGSAADGPLVDVPLADHTVLHMTLVIEPTATTGWLVSAVHR